MTNTSKWCIMHTLVDIYSFAHENSGSGLEPTDRERQKEFSFKEKRENFTEEAVSSEYKGQKGIY